MPPACHRLPHGCAVRSEHLRTIVRGDHARSCGLPVNRQQEGCERTAEYKIFKVLPRDNLLPYFSKKKNRGLTTYFFVLFLKHLWFSGKNLSLYFSRQKIEGLSQYFFVLFLVHDCLGSNIYPSNLHAEKTGWSQPLFLKKLLF